jgi:biotin synthase
MSESRKFWSLEDIQEVYNKPLLELVVEAANIHRKFHTGSEVQVSSLISIKTGGCPEDCGYCPQAARYHTDVNVHKLMQVDEVMALAQKAKDGGSSRVCMGAAWREVRDNKDFDRVIEMVKSVNTMGLEVCCTLGMLNEHQAKRLSDAGLYAYNHNLDTSAENYENIISTRTYDDRLKTIDNVRKANITVCSGGIIGMGEKSEDRCGMLQTLVNMPTPPESVPINALVAVEGTPMENQKPVSIWEMVRMIATARIVIPTTVVRLSAGRQEMSMEGQALCFLAGANSIFAGEKLLTTPNPDFDQDMEMFRILGLTPAEPFKHKKKESAGELA